MNYYIFHVDSYMYIVSPRIRPILYFQKNVCGERPRLNKDRRSDMKISNEEQLKQDLALRQALLEILPDLALKTASAHPSRKQWPEDCSCPP